MRRGDHRSTVRLRTKRCTGLFWSRSGGGAIERHEGGLKTFEAGAAKRFGWQTAHQRDACLFLYENVHADRPKTSLPSMGPSASSLEGRTSDSLLVSKRRHFWLSHAVGLTVRKSRCGHSHIPPFGSVMHSTAGTKSCGC